MWKRLRLKKKPHVPQWGPAHARFVHMRVRSQVRPLWPGLFSSPREQVHPGQEVGMITELEAALEVVVRSISRAA